MSGCHLQRISDPFSCRESTPGVRCVCRRMLPTIHEDRPVQRTHELDMICLHLSRQWILFFQNARTAETTPLVRRRVWPALILRSSPDRFGRGLGPEASCIVEWNPEVIPERWLTETAYSSGILVAFQAPFTGYVLRILRPCRLAKCGNAKERSYRE